MFLIGFLLDASRGTPSEQWTLMPYGTPMKNEPGEQNSAFQETNGVERRENALESLEKFCNTEFETLNKNQTNSLDHSNPWKMDVAKKQHNDSKSCSSPESKKGKQLTSIIDQLTINKTKDSTSDSKNKKKKDFQTSWQQFSANDARLVWDYERKCRSFLTKRCYLLILKMMPAFPGLIKMLNKFLKHRLLNVPTHGLKSQKASRGPIFQLLAAKDASSESHCVDFLIRKILN
ncbi:hypothetical protein HNY73_005564 [Argiope bruennichi]|uniref:Uncharacterized protein n=1 Tax=Argiope bruennichi TaxID=94029 RepID=A0A8T0FLW1_ARGBR|nr:hypothetical protein HNY73_005564 [Argiope bruennichi]